MPRASSKPLHNKVAVVTGSTSGIGYGIAEQLAASGCRVMLNGIEDESKGDRMANRLSRRHRRKVLYSDADMSNPDEIAALIEQAIRAFGRIDILVNNAGIQFTANIEDFPTDKWDAILAINLSSSFHTIAAALPDMKKRGWGRIINIASTHGLVASAQKAAYVAAKHGVVGLTKVAALETATSGITVNAICPGWVRTPLVEAQIDALADREGLPSESAAEQLLAAKQPSLRFTEVSQIGEMVVFLCGKAAANMTGSMITMDGGWVAQ